MSKTITLLLIQKQNKSRVNLFLDGEYAFSIGLMAAAALKKGQKLSAAEIENLQGDDEKLRAYEAALRQLGSRPRSQAEIEQFLRRKSYSDEIIAATVARLQQNGYLDDAAFAQYWSENRQQFRPRSVRALQFELRQKGVDRQMIDAALTEVDEDEAAWHAVESKLPRWRTLEEDEFEKKVKSLLARRGFSYEIAERTWRRAQAEVA